jgi:hypothetical protein
MSVPVRSDTQENELSSISPVFAANTDSRLSTRKRRRDSNDQTTKARKLTTKLRYLKNTYSYHEHNYVYQKILIMAKEAYGNSDHFYAALTQRTDIHNIFADDCNPMDY